VTQSRIGAAGHNLDSIQTTTFVLSYLTEALTVDLFADQIFALRVNSIFSPDGSRKAFAGFAKLVGTVVVVPEPSAAIMMMLGLAGLTAAGRKRSSESA
jgi:hypothetical protein